MSYVSEIPAAPSDQALAHFEAEFTFETDCWDVHHAITSNHKDFVLFDARSHDAYASGHVPTAISLPHGKIVASRLAEYAQNTLFVVYCAGPHCNGASRAARQTRSPGQADDRRRHGLGRRGLRTGA